MDRADAIRYLENSLEEIENYGSAFIGSVGECAIDTAIAALREQEQRERCNIDCVGLAKDLNITKDVLNRFRHKNCGRKLPEPPKEGAEG